jgi:hypothetical protein
MAQLSAAMTSDAVSVDVPPLFTDLQITRFSGREVGGFLVVDVEAHIDSEPLGMEYCSLTVLVGDTVLGGACWTDIPGIGGYGAVSAPADLRYTLTVPASLYGELWAAAYGRSVAKVEDRVRLDGFLR